MNQLPGRACFGTASSGSMRGRWVLLGNDHAQRRRPRAERLQTLAPGSDRWPAGRLGKTPDVSFCEEHQERGLDSFCVRARARERVGADTGAPREEPALPRPAVLLVSPWEVLLSEPAVAASANRTVARPPAACKLDTGWWCLGRWQRSVGVSGGPVQPLPHAGGRRRGARYGPYRGEHD